MDPYRRIQSRIRAERLTAGALTFGDCIRLALTVGVSVGTTVIAEAMSARNLTAKEAVAAVFGAFDHNLKALQFGLAHGGSALMGSVATELNGEQGPELTGNTLLDKAVVYTLAGQVGNHRIGLQPCAGTGDACTYAGLMRAMQEEIGDRQTIARAAAVMLKIGTLFREGKSTTGCNMEGLGAGAAASAAVFTEIAGGGPNAMESAVVLALSPTIGVPCTPRVMAPGLCATHIGGGVMIGWLASHLACRTSLPVTVPVDVMMALAAAVHPISAQALVPEVVRHMAPFFRSCREVEMLVDDAERARQEDENRTLLHEARDRIRALARTARSITEPFAPAVFGGSSQAVGSPVNTARLAHYLSRGRIRQVTITLSPELFSRRAINVPGILAAAVYGSPANDPAVPADIFQRVMADGVAVTLDRGAEAGIQQVAIRADEKDSMVKALNRGGGRIHLREALPGLAQARRLAAALDIEVAA